MCSNILDELSGNPMPEWEEYPDVTLPLKK